MKYLLILLSLTTATHALIDENNNGLSDLWEQTHNNGDLFSETYDPQADPDQDGWTNAQEAAAGTDPGDPNPPDGFLSPDLLHTPAVMSVDENGQPMIATFEVLTVSWPTLIGKQYTLLFSPDLSATSWLQVPDSQFIGDGNIHEFHFDLSSGDRCFWRVSVTDFDTDEDGLSNAEEHTLGTNPSLADTDSDTIPDSEEIALGSDPADFDSDDDQITNAEETESGTDMNDSEDFPPYWIWAKNQVDGGSKKFTIDNTYSVTYSYSMWDGTAIGDKKLQDQSSDFAPSDMVTERDTLSLPETDSEAEAMIGQGYAWATTVKSGAYPVSTASFYRNVDSSGSGASISAVRCWLRVPKKDQPQQFQFLKHVHHTRSGGGDDLAETISCDVFPVNIAANQTTSAYIDLTNETSVNAGNTNVTTTGLVPVEIHDNTPATGVDATSIRSATTDIGHQAKFWIMAPSGNAPDGSPCSNDMQFKIPFQFATSLNCYPPNPTPPAIPPPGLPSPVNVPLAPGPADCSWHGTAATTTETPEVDWKISSPGQQPGISVALPIGVKAMKRRTVKVAVWPVRMLGKSEVPIEQSLKTSIEEKLDQIFAYQTNAWFDVTYKPGVEVDLVDETVTVPMGGGMTTTLEYTHADGAKEKTMIAAHAATDVDINIFLIATNGYVLPEGEYRLPLNGWSYPPQEPGSGNYKNSSVVRRNGGDDGTARTIAHEIGHLLVGGGHPDRFDALIPGSGGKAPLQNLPLSAHKKRLMCSGNHSDEHSKLLVKTEWDEADKWLSTRPNGDN